MKFLFLLIMLIMNISCKEEVAGWEALSSDERAEISNRATTKCMSSSQVSYTNFQTTSDRQFDAGNAKTFVRNQAWEITSKKEDTELSKSKIYVWKVDTNVVYFLWEDNTAEGFTTTRFLKIPSDTNNEMIADLREKRCKSVAQYSISESASTVVMKPVATTTGIDANTRLHVETTYTFNFNELAFMGIFHEKRVQKKLNNDGTVASTENYTLEMTPLANPITLPASYSSYTTASFCVVKSIAGTPPSYPFHYKTDLNCAPSAAEFDPANEL